jgi:hypothetical protein
MRLVTSQFLVGYSEPYLDHHVDHVGDGVDKVRVEGGIRLDALLGHVGRSPADGRDQECDVDRKLAQQRQDDVPAGRRSFTEVHQVHAK